MLLLFSFLEHFFRAHHKIFSHLAKCSLCTEKLDNLKSLVDQWYGVSQAFLGCLTRLFTRVNPLGTRLLMELGLSGLESHISAQIQGIPAWRHNHEARQVLSNTNHTFFLKT